MAKCRIFMSYCWSRGALFTLLLCSGFSGPAVGAIEPWFEKVKASATPQQLYRFLYAMPKGGDLHNHLGGAARSEWYWEAALAAESQGYVYYTRVRLGNCQQDANFDGIKTPLLFKNIQSNTYSKLDPCTRSEFKQLRELDAREKRVWLASLRLDQPYKGRDEFFDAVWGRIDALLKNPYLVCNILLHNMQAFGREGLLYLETQQSVEGAVRADGSPYSIEETVAIYRQFLVSPAAKATSVEVRFQNPLLRFTPDAEEHLRVLYCRISSDWTHLISSEWDHPISG